MNLKRLALYPHELGHLLGYTKLLPVHSDIIKYLWRGEGDKVLQAFRGSYKTTAAVIVGAIWYLFFNPDARILICREEAGGAAATLGEIQRQYESAAMIALYDQAYGIKNFRLKDASGERITLPTKTKITKEGSIEGIGVGGSITGRHYDRVHTDDIVTLRDRISRAKRELTKAYVRELKNVVNIGGRLTHTGTPWARDDAFSILPDALRYPIGTIPIPEMTPEVIADIRQRTTPALWAANYELRHISDQDRIFGDPKYLPWNAAARPIMLIDPAYSGKNTTAVSIAYKDQARIIVRGYVWREDITNLYARIVSIAREYNCTEINIEINADKGLSLIEMRKYFPICKGYHESTNKHAKIVGNLKRYYPDVYFADDCQSEYIAQILDYAEGIDPDDAPDSLAALVRLLCGDIKRELKVY